MECFSNGANSTALPGQHLLLISPAPEALPNQLVRKEGVGSTSAGLKFALLPVSARFSVHSWEQCLLFFFSLSLQLFCVCVNVSMAVEQWEPVRPNWDSRRSVPGRTVGHHAIRRFTAAASTQCGGDRAKEQGHVPAWNRSCIRVHQAQGGAHRVRWKQSARYRFRSGKNISFSSLLFQSLLPLLAHFLYEIIKYWLSMEQHNEHISVFVLSEMQHIVSIRWQVREPTWVSGMWLASHSSWARQLLMGRTWVSDNSKQTSSGLLWAGFHGRRNTPCCSSLWKKAAGFFGSPVMQENLVTFLQKQKLLLELDFLLLKTLGQKKIFTGIAKYFLTKTDNCRESKWKYSLQFWSKLIFILHWSSHSSDLIPIRVRV